MPTRWVIWFSPEQERLDVVQMTLNTTERLDRLGLQTVLCHTHEEVYQTLAKHAFSERLVIIDATDPLRAKTIAKFCAKLRISVAWVTADINHVPKGHLFIVVPDKRDIDRVLSQTERWAQTPATT